VPLADDSRDIDARVACAEGFTVFPGLGALIGLAVDAMIPGKVILDDPMDAVELVSRLRHNDCTRSTPIIVLTARVWPTKRARAEGAGCDVFLPQPCLPNDLLDEVRQLIAATRSQAADTPRGCQPPSHRAARVLTRSL
jgi:DNA-binding response OmpR family regulator